MLAAAKVLLKYSEALQNEQLIIGVCKKVSSPLISLLNGPHETAWVLLRNIQVIAEKYTEVFPNARVFFANYNDPPYVKIEKLKIIYKLCDKNNFKLVINELVEYSYDVNQDFSREAVRRLWRISIRLPEAREDCITALNQILVNSGQNTFADHLINEAAIGLSYIYRKYTNKTKLGDSVAILVQNYTRISEEEALIGFLNILPDFEYLIHNKKDLIVNYSEAFTLSPLSVQSAILTAMVKLYVKNPDEFAEEVIEILQAAAENVQNPDIRDRAFMYWRLLDISPVIAKKILFVEKEPIEGELDPNYLVLSKNLDQLGSLEVTMNLKPHKADETTVLMRKEKKVENMLNDEFKENQKDDLLELDVDRPLENVNLDQLKIENATNKQNDLFDVFDHSGQKASVKTNKEAIDVDIMNFGVPKTETNPKSTTEGNKYSELDVVTKKTEPKPEPEPLQAEVEPKKKGESAFDFDMYDNNLNKGVTSERIVDFKKNSMVTVLPINSVGKSGKTGIKVSGALIATDVDLGFHFELKNTTNEEISFIKFKLMPNLYGFSVENNAAKVELQPQRSHKMVCGVTPTDMKTSEWRLDNNHSFHFELITDYDEFEFTVKSHVNSLMVI